MGKIQEINELKDDILQLTDQREKCESKMVQYKLEKQQSEEKYEMLQVSYFIRKRKQFYSVNLCCVNMQLFYGMTDGG